MYTSTHVDKQSKTMENKIILFTNIKGGVGKTTLCSIFATYAAQQGIPVIVLDADIQQSLFRHRERDIREWKKIKEEEQRAQGIKDPVEYEPKIPWKIQSVSTSDDEMVETLMQRIKAIPGWVIVDCPGNINDHALKYIYQAADVAVVPYGFDTDTLDATTLFCSIFQRVSKAKFAFIPNNIIVSDERRDSVKVQREKSVEVLGNLGLVTHTIKHAVAVKIYNTLAPLDYWQEKVVKHALDPVLDYIKGL